MMFKFEMKFNNMTVAKGEATATMCYDFQKAYVEGIGSKANSMEGEFIKLEHFFLIPMFHKRAWKTVSAEGVTWEFIVERK